MLINVVYYVWCGVVCVVVIGVGVGVVCAVLKMVGMALAWIGAVWVWCRGVVYVVRVACVVVCGVCGVGAVLVRWLRGVGVDVGCVGLVRVGVCVCQWCVWCVLGWCVSLGRGKKGTANGVKPNNPKHSDMFETV